VAVLCIPFVEGRAGQSVPPKGHVEPGASTNRGVEANCLSFALGRGTELCDHQGGIFLNSCFNGFVKTGYVKDEPLVQVSIISS